MAVEFKTVSDAFSVSNITSLVVPHPAGLAVGDFMLGSNIAGRSTNVPQVPAGWTVIAGPFLQVAISQVMFFKFADSADVAAGSTTFTLLSTPDGMAGSIMRFTGVCGAEAFLKTQFQGLCDPGFPMGYSGVTSLADNAFIVMSLCVRDSVNPITPLTAGWTEQVDGKGIGANNVVHAVYTRDALITPPGAVESFEHNCTGGVALRHTIGIMVSLSELPGGSGGIMAAPSAPSQPQRETIERGIPIKNPFGGRVRRNACMCIGKCVCS